VKVKKPSRKQLAKELLSSARKEMKTPGKTKSVRDAESKQKHRPHKSEMRSSMTAKFQLRNLVYNRNTKEDGAIRKVYETNGAGDL